jgi:nucleoside-diphosphate-sugar epimerase
LRRVGDGSNLIDITFVENAADAHVQAVDRLAADSPVAGNVYFISQGEPVICWDWIDQILQTAGLPKVQKSISGGMAFRIAATFEGLYRIFRWQAEPRMTRFLAAQLGTSHYFDIRRAQRDLGYAPRISTEEGMRRLADSLGNR